MKTILTIAQKDIDPNSSEVDTTNFRKREAARAVLLDPKGRVYLLHVTNHGYHKLPGGGIDEGENIARALERELMEEVGCQADIIDEVGKVIEYRSYEDMGLLQTSYCYLAKQTSEQVSSNLQEDELAQGMTEIKASDIQAAIALLEQDEPDNPEGKFIQKRDLALLCEAARILK